MWEPVYLQSIHKEFHEEDLQKGLFIVVLHATRIPPHIGMIANGKYHSLSIKGQEINKSIEALTKNTVWRKIPSLFIKIKPHKTFSDIYLKEHFISDIQQFLRVDIGIATCLSPLKLFFEEVYNMPMKNVDYLYQLLPLLETKGLIENTSSLFLDETNYQLPIYSLEEINAGIELVRSKL